MKHILIIAAVLSIMFCSAAPLTAHAADDPASIIGGDNVNITVVLPPNEEQDASVPQANEVYPISVWESREYGHREIIRVYELSENDDSQHIRRAPFERDGFRFELAEITRREMPVYSAREHMEVVSVNTRTNDLTTVMQLLSPALEFMSEDGYFGVLSLDISTIQNESMGTTTSSHTVTRRREFSHLTSPDTALVPRTITDGGRTYSLYSVEWQTQRASETDYRDVPTTFTAIATYTGTARRTSTIGYTTTAAYRGTLSRITTGRVQYTVYFIGTPISKPEINVEVSMCCVESEDTFDYAQTESNIIADVPTNADSYERGNGGFPVIAGIIVFVVVIPIAYFVGKKGKEKLAKKVSCLLIAGCLMFSISQTAYAAAIPSYGFGRRDENAVHFDTSSTVVSGGVIHLDPRVVETSAFRVINTNPQCLSEAGAIRHESYIYGERIGRLAVERLNRIINVYAGATMAAMDHGAGHFSFTGINQGNTGLVGHNRGRSNGFFIFVRGLREGDILTLDAGGVLKRYAVAKVYEIDENDFEPLMQFGDNRLTLVTCVEYRPSLRRIAVAFEVE